jgi:hypothetical protein
MIDQANIGMGAGDQDDNPDDFDRANPLPVDDAPGLGDDVEQIGPWRRGQTVGVPHDDRLWRIDRLGIDTVEGAYASLRLADRGTLTGGSTPLDMLRIATPGVYPEITETQYHADPVHRGSLSSTGARILINRTPAHFDHFRTAPEPIKREFDVGSAAHALVLGTGPELDVIAGDGKGGPDAWTTNAVKDKVAAARKAGKLPIRPGDHERVQGMAAALRAHPLAGRLLDPARGRSEVTIVWQDPITGVWCRALIDYLWHPVDAEYMFYLPDYKTTDDASPAAMGRAMARWDYHVQGEFYADGVRALGIAAPGQVVRPCLIAQEKEPPYLVSVNLPDRDARMVAQRKIREARELYAECTAVGEWPGYGDEAHVIELPPWETRELRDEVSW